LIAISEFAGFTFIEVPAKCTGLASVQLAVNEWIDEFSRSMAAHGTSTCLRIPGFVF
jgi:hypothetical protein